MDTEIYLIEGYDKWLSPHPQNLARSLNSAQVASQSRRQGSYRKGSKLEVKRRDGTAYVEIRDLAPCQVLVAASHPEKEEGEVT